MLEKIKPSNNYLYSMTIFKTCEIYLRYFFININNSQWYLAYCNQIHLVFILKPVLNYFFDKGVFNC